MQLDSRGNWEYLHHMVIGDRDGEGENWLKWNRIKIAIPLKNNGFAVLGNSLSQDTAHVLLAIANPCDPKFCANLGAKKIGPIEPTYLKIGPTQIPTSISRNVKPIAVKQSKMPIVFKRNICTNCVLPTLNLKDSVFCDANMDFTWNLLEPNCSIKWNDGDTSGIKQFNTPGEYWVTKSNACGMVTDTFQLRQFFQPVNILTDRVKLCLGNKFEINATQTVPGDFTYIWSNGKTGPVQQITDSERLILTTTESHCGSRVDTLTITRIDCGCEMCIPNSFTPYNKDGVNDFWMPETKCMNTQCELQGGSYMIYNRWGEKIVDKAVSEAWDGRDVFGDFVPSGVYVYLIEVVYDQTNGSSKVVRKTGNITIL